jgi:hypothetical protein
MTILDAGMEGLCYSSPQCVAAGSGVMMREGRGR